MGAQITIISMALTNLALASVVAKLVKHL